MRRGRPRYDDVLTPREWQVLSLIEEGLLNEQIAQRLDISYGGAKYHVAEILSKLGVNSREEAAEWAKRRREPALPLFAMLGQRLGSTTPAWLAGVAAVALVLAGAVLVGTPGGNESGGRHEAESGPGLDGAEIGSLAARQEAEAFLRDIEPMAPPRPGQVLYTRTEVYTRYGPKAEEIAAVNGIPVERYTLEQWLEAGPDNTLVRAYGRLIDEAGTVFQAHSVEDGVSKVVDPRTGRDPRARRGPEGMPADARVIPHLSHAISAHLAQLEDGTARVLSATGAQVILEALYDQAYYERLVEAHPSPLTHGPSRSEEEREQAKRERVDALLQRKDYEPGEFGVPFFGDLAAQAKIHRDTIREDGLTVLADVLIHTEDGAEVLVSRAKITDHEYLDAIPPEVISLVP